MTDDHHQRVHAGKGVWHSVGSGRREGEGHSIETERVLGDIYTYMYDYRHTSSNHIGRRFFIKERERDSERDRGEDSIERAYYYINRAR